MEGADSAAGVRSQRDPDRDDGMAIGDGVLAVLGGLTLLLSLSLVGNPGLMGGLLLVAVLALLTGVATYTAVTGRSPSPIARVLGGVLAVSAVWPFLLGVDHLLVIGIPMLAVAAGIGRTRSWRLRLVGLGGVVGLLVVVWVAG